ncbi:hypothetical protein MACK_000489 [Theileria orientalis]|uniref:Ribosome production factor 2 homolog n=1 Tax=Theileria orientalis TaxID=68886 RepID=A0A976MA20_THEOR|nr:hypothetical protein MACK_000489 [Theileria orientalis]
MKSSNKSAKIVSKGSKKAILREEHKLKKTVLYLLSNNSNNPTKQLLKSLYQLNKDHGLFRVNSSTTSAKNDGKGSANSTEAPLKLAINANNHRLAELICRKLNLGLYIVANSNKKRPINMGFGRVYDGHVLDCCQLKVIDYKMNEEFKHHMGNIGANSRPLVIAQGSQFSQDSGPLNTLRSILFDVFRGPSYAKLSLENVQQVIVLTLLDDNSTTSTSGNTETKDTATHTSTDTTTLTSTDTTTHTNTDTTTPESGSVSAAGQHRLLFRRYAITLTKATSSNSNITSNPVNLPNVHLTEIGPSIDFLVEEVMEPDGELFKMATKAPKKPKKLIAGITTVDSVVDTSGEVTNTPVSTKPSRRGKNVRTSALGNVEGKVYLDRQDLSDLYTRHNKFSKKRKMKRD